MFRKLLLTAVLALATVSAFAKPGESAYCLANCPASTCIAQFASLGQANLTLGLPLAVSVVSPGNNMLVPATSYSWNFAGGPHGTPTNLAGISSDTTDNFTIAKVKWSDEGLYIEEGFAAGGDDVQVICLTVSPGILGNNLYRR